MIGGVSGRVFVSGEAGKRRGGGDYIYHRREGREVGVGEDAEVTSVFVWLGRHQLFKLREWARFIALGSTDV